MVTMAGFGPPLLRTQMTKLSAKEESGVSDVEGTLGERDRFGALYSLCTNHIGLSGLYLRTCDAKGKEITRAQPIDGTFGDIEVLGGSG